MAVRLTPGDYSIGDYAVGRVDRCPVICPVFGGGQGTDQSCALPGECQGVSMKNESIVLQRPQEPFA